MCHYLQYSPSEGSPREELAGDVVQQKLGHLQPASHTLGNRFQHQRHHLPPALSDRAVPGMDPPSSMSLPPFTGCNTGSLHGKPVWADSDMTGMTEQLFSYLPVDTECLLLVSAYSSKATLLQVTYCVFDDEFPTLKCQN